MSERISTPFIKLSKREGMKPAVIWSIRIGSILFAFILGMIPLMMAGANPFASYGIIISGSLSKKFVIQQTIKREFPFWDVH